MWQALFEALVTAVVSDATTGGMFANASDASVSFAMQAIGAAIILCAIGFIIQSVAKVIAASNNKNS